MGMVGASKLRLALLTIMLGSLMGALVGFIFIKLPVKRQPTASFGSFLGIAAILSALWGGQIVGRYTSIFQFFDPLKMASKSVPFLTFNYP
jgi:prepilin signal peptidase PulO-like enzyme (type II secretory pathway)